MVDHRSRLASIVREHEAHILADWTGLLAKSNRGTIDRAEGEEQARAFVRLLAEALSHDGSGEIDGPAWARVRDMLAGLSTSRAKQGLSPSETATFIFSLRSRSSPGCGRSTAPTRKGSRASCGPPPCCSTSSASSPPRPSGGRERTSSRASSARCSSCPPRWSRSGKASSRCR